MKDKLEPNMYVRTKYSGIGKIVEYINDPTHYFFKCYKLDRNYTNYEEYITEVDVLKASHNIIDLIEVGDYVNGYYVEDVLKTFVNVAVGSNYFQSPTIYEKDIKSIVTKEMFSSMEYRLGDDK